MDLKNLALLRYCGAPNFVCVYIHIIWSLGYTPVRLTPRAYHPVIVGCIFHNLCHNKFWLYSFRWSRGPIVLVDNNFNLVFIQLERPLSWLQFQRVFFLIILLWRIRKSYLQDVELLGIRLILLILTMKVQLVNFSWFGKSFQEIRKI